jgi:hypothetical protein
MIEPGSFAVHRADPPTSDRRTNSLEHRGCFHKDGSRLTQMRGEQQDADSAEDKADQRDYDRVECACLGRPEGPERERS